jgi:hypothetical protein
MSYFPRRAKARDIESSIDGSLVLFFLLIGLGVALYCFEHRTMPDSVGGFVCWLVWSCA